MLAVAWTSVTANSDAADDLRPLGWVSHRHTSHAQSLLIQHGYVGYIPPHTS
jgi:hypothetical protein